MDSSPVVFMTCNVGENLLGKDSFQEVESSALPCDHESHVSGPDASLIPDVIREAFAVAATGRPGPVLIDFLKSATMPSVMIDYKHIPRKDHHNHGRVKALNRRSGWDLKAPEPNMTMSTTRFHDREIEKTSDHVRRRCRAEPASDEFLEFAEKIDAPVGITLMGGGGFPSDHPLTTGMIGMHGTRASNIACDSCDLLIAIGCRFSDRVALDPETFAPHAKIVHIDIDRAEIGKNILTDHHIIGDAKRVLQLLNERLPKQEHVQWRAAVDANKLEETCGDDQTLTPKHVIDIIRNEVPDDSIVVTDVGQHQIWSAQYFKFKYPGQLITSGGFGTMGFGLGAAIGAKLGNPDKLCSCDGRRLFRMNGRKWPQSPITHPISVIFTTEPWAWSGSGRTSCTTNGSPRHAGFLPGFCEAGGSVRHPPPRTNGTELEAAVREAVAWGHCLCDRVYELAAIGRKWSGRGFSGGQPSDEYILLIRRFEDEF
jgi:acetolactate synthase-1/2/3 large subunit